MIYIGNTTFVVERNLEDSFKEWACGTLLEAARSSQHFDRIRLLRILTEIDPSTVNYALQLECTSPQVIKSWINDVAILLLDDLRNRVGENVLFFMTEMEVVSDV